MADGYKKGVIRIAKHLVEKLCSYNKNQMQTTTYVYRFFPKRNNFSCLVDEKMEKYMQITLKNFLKKIIN
jgi:hypothetical protein